MAIQRFRSEWRVSCWAGQVVVVQGELTYKDEKAAAADVEVIVNTPPTDEQMSEGKQTLPKTVYKFRVAKLTPSRFFFAAPGITTLSPDIASLAHGELKTLHVLVRLHGDRATTEFANRKIAVYVLHYNPVVPEYPLVLEEGIPNEDLASAEKMFKLRNKFDHRSSQVEQPGPAQPATQPADKEPPKDQPSPPTPKDAPR